MNDRYRNETNSTICTPDLTIGKLFSCTEYIAYVSWSESFSVGAAIAVYLHPSVSHLMHHLCIY